MNVEISDIALADTLRYRVQVQKSLAQEDVRVGVEVTALASTQDTDQKAIEGRIREALAAFIPAEWAFSQIRRYGDAVGYERVTLRATARVKNAENRALAERARRASREGLTLGEPTLDYRLSAEKVGQVLEELRLQAVEQVSRQIADFSAVTGRSWRIGDIEFGVGPWDPRRTVKGGYREEADFLSGGIPDDDSGEPTGTERVVLVAQVTLRAATTPGQTT